MKLSIITVCFNDIHNLQKTISSVESQNDLSATEFIVVDGNSNDGTVALLNEKKKNNIIDISISEPDEGIYDAMNKGLFLSSGEYVLFLNAGDLFFKNNTLKQILEIISEEINDIILFGCTGLNDTKLRPSYRGNFERLKYDSFGCHQGYIVRASVLKKLRFNTKYKVKADRDFLLRAYKSNMTFLDKRGVNLSRYDTNGISSQLIFRKEWENLLITIDNFDSGILRGCALFVVKILMLTICKLCGIKWKNFKNFLLTFHAQK